MVRMEEDLRVTGKRRYQQSRRAESTDRTRRRIVEATVGLHLTVGPAATHITEVARRAGVRRATVYDHFQDEAALMAACSAHWRALHPAPDPTPWLAIRDPAVRLATGLGELYAWYRETEAMTSRVLRDAETMPALRSIIDQGLAPYVEGVRARLVEPFRANAGEPERIEAASRVAVSFHTWMELAPLGDPEAARLAGALVELASGDGSRQRDVRDQDVVISAGQADPVR